MEFWWFVFIDINTLPDWSTILLTRKRIKYAAWSEVHLALIEWIFAAKWDDGQLPVHAILPVCSLLHWQKFIHHCLNFSGQYHISNCRVVEIAVLKQKFYPREQEPILSGADLTDHALSDFFFLRRWKVLTWQYVINSCSCFLPSTIAAR